MVMDPFFVVLPVRYLPSMGPVFVRRIREFSATFRRFFGVSIGDNRR